MVSKREKTDQNAIRRTNDTLFVSLSFIYALHKIKTDFLFDSDQFGCCLQSAFMGSIHHRCVAVFVIGCSFKMINVIDIASQMCTFTNNHKMIEKEL